jgi:hypothetical protein
MRVSAMSRALGLFATTRGRLAIADPQFTNSPLRPGDAVA